jgi:hypothetical protein
MLLIMCIFSKALKINKKGVFQVYIYLTIEKKWKEKEIILTFVDDQLYTVLAGVGAASAIGEVDF